IPLLFEGGNDKLMDIVVVVSAPADVQRARVLERPGMSEAMLNTILTKQLPDAQKRSRADFIVPTQTLEEAQNAVQDVLKQISERLKNA
ncbi:MAG: dephospho-CoA kinase, partial [Marinosulfonomonas sp.]|nr:dephospho-CoA kinase [Marinosulfonomonas sp.]